MREIKFRAYDKYNKIMVYDFDQNIPDIYHLKLGDSIHQLVYDIGMVYGTLMQYTGLKDSNKKEIYEGDILKAGNIIGTVFYKAPAFELKTKTTEVFLICNDTFEIIGNIYENPEMLNAKTD
jgi:uncharacterized phage protein (TIGR01671 family)